jgi:hypothetical protein
MTSSSYSHGPECSNYLGNRQNRARDDPNFDTIVSELRDIQGKVDTLLFGSVFLRRPEGLLEGAFGLIL